jgi:hypothetical protein
MTPPSTLSSSNTTIGDIVELRIHLMLGLTTWRGALS